MELPSTNVLNQHAELSIIQWWPWP